MAAANRPEPGSMDALALLCNLHADGPATLQILRKVGCDTLADVVEAKVEELGSHLEMTPRAAKRFQREAGILVTRLDGELLEPLRREEIGEASPPRSFLPGNEAGETVEAVEAVESGETGEGSARPPLDEVEGSGSPETDEAGVPDGDSEGASRFPLVPGAFEELTGGLTEKLLREGIETIGDLVDGDPLTLSGKIGIGYTRLLRLQFQARRHLRALDGAPIRDVELVPPPPPPSEDRLEASGPFA
jgi:hypothetical protein